MSLGYYELSKELAYVRGQLYDSEKDRARLMEENARLREALERIEAGQLCRAQQCDCGSSPEEIARAALEEEEEEE